MLGTLDEACEHTPHVGIEHDRSLTEGKRKDRGRGVVADAGQ